MKQSNIEMSAQMMMSLDTRIRQKTASIPKKYSSRYYFIVYVKTGKSMLIKYY